MPRFSIVVPAYNADDTLAETLDAILQQGVADWECIVVDDGSRDGTLALAESYASTNTRIRVISQENRGSAGAYNTGVAAAEGEFVILCSADDILLPEYLVEMARFIDANPNFDIYSTNGYFWRPEDSSRSLVYLPGERDKVMSLSLADVIRLCFFSVGAAYRREWFERVGGYRLGVFGEDYDFWLRTMAAGAKHIYLPEALSLHRVSPKQKSANLERAYRSDIALVTQLRDSVQLSDEELAAVDESVRYREHLIEQLHARAASPGMKSRVLSMLKRLLGEERTRRLVRAVKRGGAGPNGSA